MNHLAVINERIKEKGYSSYLEIGVGHRSWNLDKVRCAYKVGVDINPKSEADAIMTSDDFFARNTTAFDLIFIDGDHSREATQRDIDNAIKCLNKGGTIMVHDCAPGDEWLARPASEVVPGSAWCGQAWEAVYATLCRGDVGGYVTALHDYGVAVLYPRKRKSAPLPEILEYSKHYNAYIKEYGRNE